ncbi:potassium channel family protein [Reichenbachiella carrageenanivorans]|uniref:Potassium channel family protein n=1 Tax=Reichenbachiella carrageenanivorans TaxID=2979869 RepID=A0ABY6CWA8_9BACT|nr:potassium channel family protein [Reichenbachiella carrageenanivorans]UXX78190.1 potassium channel family protein [Reichenbachiella carrageenanivorans]
MPYRYHIILVVILVNILVPGFFPDDIRTAFVAPAFNVLLLGACFLVIQRMRKAAMYIAMAGVLGVIFNWFDGYTGLIGLLILSIYVLITAFELFSDLVRKEKIGLPEILGAFDGYMLIGYIGALLCLAIHIAESGAFAHVVSGRAGAQDLLYFSYITMLTIGYGDIVPLIPASKGLSIVLGLIGQFYLVVVVATFVGKFLIHSNEK